jgi:hypothetical protein
MAYVRNLQRLPPAWTGCLYDLRKRLCYGGSETIGKSKISASVAEFPNFKGGFAEYTYLFPGTFVWKIPDDMPSEIAALLDPMAVAVRAIAMTQTESGVLTEALNTSTPGSGYRRWSHRDDGRVTLENYGNRKGYFD